MGRIYYSRRTGTSPEIVSIDFNMLCRLFLAGYTDFTIRGYFQETFGIDCVDGFCPGTAGPDIGAYIFRKLRRDVWPIHTRVMEYSEEELFDVIELLYDLVSKPLDGWVHAFGDCGTHWKTFDKIAGQEEFRKEINDIFLGYGEGYELNDNGEIVFRGDPGLESLLNEEPPEFDPDNVDEKLRHAIRRFRHHRASVEERREAARALADILEFLRPRLNQIITKKDEGALFKIANEFSIRHHNFEQQKDYDQELFLKWIFYWYLATIRLVLDVLTQRKQA